MHIASERHLEGLQKKRKKKISKIENYQVSRGDLILKTIETRQEPILLEKIFRYVDIPDYVIPGNSPHPLLVQIESSYFCIDGWEIIKKAKQKNQKTILCEIQVPTLKSKVAVGILKVTSRVVPRSGKCLYPELLRNLRILSRLLREEHGQIKKHLHGGDRRSETFSKIQGKDEITLLSKILLKSRKTILKYFVHEEYLDDATLNFLIENRASKDFFESAQRIKRNIVKTMKSDEYSSQHITGKISELMRIWWKEYEERGRITSGYSDIQLDRKNRTKISTRRSEDRMFKHFVPNKPQSRKIIFNLNGIMQEFKAELANLGAILDSSDLNLDRFHDLLINHLKFILRQTRKLESLRSATNIDTS